MSKKNIEKYIPQALEAVKELRKKLNKEEIPSEFNSYISSFGASIIQSGLLPTIAMYQHKSDNRAYDITLIPSMILHILDKNKKNSTLLEYAIDHKDKTWLKDQILDISVALKLSIRTFKLDKGETYE